MIYLVSLIILLLFIVAIFTAFEDEKFSIFLLLTTFIASIVVRFLLNYDLEFQIAINMLSVLSVVGVLTISNGCLVQSEEWIDNDNWEELEF